MAYQIDTHVLKGGHVRIYRRREGGRFHARITLPNEPGFQKKVSLETFDPAEARDRAVDRYQELTIKRSLGHPLQPKTVADAIAAFIEDQERKHAKEEITAQTLYNQKLFLKKWNEFIGKRPLHDLKRSDIDAFDGWRAKQVADLRAKGQAKFAKARLSEKAQRNYATTFKTALTYAASLGWVPRDAIPIIKSKLGKARRPNFEPDHLAQIKESLLDWEKSAKTSKQRKVWPQYRLFFTIMLNSGLRLGELRRLQWKHIQQREGNGHLYDLIIVPKATKTGERECVPLLTTGLWFDELRMLYENVWGFSPTADDYVFCDLKRAMRRKFDHVMRKILDRAGVTHNSNGSRYTIYSTRHTYATDRLVKRVDVYPLAANMGTSVAMIERHYGHLKPMQAAATLAAPSQAGITEAELRVLMDRCGLKDATTPANDNELGQAAEFYAGKRDNIPTSASRASDLTKDV